MNLLKLAIRFIIATNRTRKDGTAPLLCRLTLSGKRKQFSTGTFINPKKWNSKLQKAYPPNEENNNINAQLSLIKTKMNQAFLFLKVKGESFTVEDLYLQYKGENISTEKTLMEVFNLHNARMEKLIGKEYSKATYYKFKEAKSHTSNFLQYKYGRTDILLSVIKLSFLEHLDYYFKTELNQKQITINKTIQRVRKIIKLAMGEGYLDKDPFILYKPKKYKVEVIYLSSKELGLIEEHQFTNNERLERVRDCFVFCCYTGLAYAEMSALKNDHIFEGLDGNKWIKMKRKKTNSLIKVPLLPKAIEILSKYNNLNTILPVISNQKFNSYLKEIAAIVGIDKRLTHHIARKTFASTVLLYNDVPMEVVSKLLGHNSIKTTETYYGRVIDKKVKEHFNTLKRKMESRL